MWNYQKTHSQTKQNTDNIATTPTLLLSPQTAHNYTCEIAIPETTLNPIKKPLASAYPIPPPHYHTPKPQD